MIIVIIIIVVVVVVVVKFRSLVSHIKYHLNMCKSTTTKISKHFKFGNKGLKYNVCISDSQGDNNARLYNEMQSCYLTMEKIRLMLDTKATLCL
jgi:hypothetical protein